MTTIGYLRPTARNTKARQLRMVRPHADSDGHIVVEGEDRKSLEHAIKVLRPGRTLVVSELAVIATQREPLKEALSKVFAKGARIMEASTGRTTDTPEEAMHMALDALKRRNLTPERASEMGRLSSGPAIDDGKKEATRKLWTSDMTNAEIEAECGISYPTLRRYWVTDRIARSEEPVHRGRRPGQRVSNEDAE